MICTLFTFDSRLVKIVDYTTNVSLSIIIETAFGGTLAPVLSLEWLSFR
jgi:hypothetical protein